MLSPGDSVANGATGLIRPNLTPGYVETPSTVMDGLFYMVASKKEIFVRIRKLKILNNNAISTLVQTWPGFVHIFSKFMTFIPG